MNCEDKVIIVTGGAHGIGRALVNRFASEKARAIIIADVDLAAAQAVSDEVGGMAIKTDVSNEADVIKLVTDATEKYGQIDLVCSNAGIAGEAGGAEVGNDVWQKIWEVNVMSHIYLARAVLPQMLERGSGYLLLTVSAAGLLTHFEAAPYTVTKHAALSFGEWLSIVHHDAGIRVSCLCPQGVNTRMILGEDGTQENFLREGALEPQQVADSVIEGLEDERFLILPHPEVADYFRHKATDYERWLRGLRRMRESVLSARI
jgi:NAD(P)-dependent dehydrogenase (short-subunit alcohol dehydrogenase family)